MSVSHPNCISTYKLSVIRLLREDEGTAAAPSAAAESPTGAAGASDAATDAANATAGAAAAGAGTRLSASTDMTDDTALVGCAGSSAGAGGAAEAAAATAAAASSSDPGNLRFSVDSGGNVRLSGGSSGNAGLSGGARSSGGGGRTLARTSRHASASTGALASAAASGSAAPRRRVYSLLSGCEAAQVADPYAPLQPGLYETWIVSEVRVPAGLRPLSPGWSRVLRSARQAGILSGAAWCCAVVGRRGWQRPSAQGTRSKADMELPRPAVPQFCDRGTLVDALASSRLRNPDGTPNLVSLPVVWHACSPAHSTAARSTGPPRLASVCGSGAWASACDRS
jgi:hypothetical protein